MTVEPTDSELRMANLLIRLHSPDQTDSANDAEIETELDDLSFEEVQQLHAVNNCLLMLDDVRAIETDSTLRGEANTTVRVSSGSPKPVPAKVARYEIGELIGRGGFASVYSALDPELNRRVAIKIPHAGVLELPDARERFQREARAAATLSHPAIVPVFESGVADGTHFIAFEFCEGESLAAYLESNSKLSSNVAAKVVSTLAEALHHAHQRGVIHRDMKPGNILISSAKLQSENPDSIAGAVQIADFGLVRFDQPDSNDQSLTMDGAVVGTPAYMSPEQASGKGEIGPASDIFSLGVVLYQLLTGVVPHKKPTHLETLNSIVSDEPAGPRTINSGVATDLEAICLKCIRKEPDKRYQNAFELHRDLERWLADLPVSARRISQFETAIRWCRRNPAIAASMTVAILSLAIGATLATMNWLEAERERAAAVTAQNEAALEARRRTELLDAFVDTYRQINRTPGSRDLSLDTMLKLTRDQVSTRLVEDPVAQAEMFAMLADCFSGIGAYEDAASCLELELQILEDEKSDLELICSKRTGLMMTYRRCDRFEDALALQSDTVEMCRSNAGENAPLTIRHRTQEAMCLFFAGQRERAIEQLQQLFGETEVAVNDAELRAFVANRLALLLNRTNRSENVVAIFENLIPALEIELDRLNGELISTRQNLARAYRNTRQFEDAIKLQNSVIDARLENGATALEAQRTLVAILNEAGEYEQAKVSSEKVVDHLVAGLGLDHPRTLDAMISHSVQVRDATGVAQAIELQKDICERCERTIGSSNLLTIEARMALAKSYRLIGNAELAVESSEAAAAGFAMVESPFFSTEESILRDTARSLAVVGLVDQSLSTFEQLYQLRCDEYGKTGPTTLQVRIEAAFQLLRIRDFAAAGEMLQQILVDGKPRSSSHACLLAYAMFEQGRTDEALELIEQNDLTRARSPLRPVARNLYGACLAVTDTSQETESLLLDSYEDIHDSWIAYRPDTYESALVRTQTRFVIEDAARRIADFYATTGDENKRVTWQDKINSLNESIPAIRLED
ncbi:MAG: serine/threonine-protein kinase [Planctomycetota bacterium]